MEEQRARARASAAARGRARTRASGCARSRPRAGAPSTFTGYETTEQATAVGAVDASRTAACWPSSSSRPFYATGGGQVHDGGVIECEDGGCRARVVDVVRLRRRPGAGARAADGRAARRRARVRARGSQRPPRDRVQPHGDAPAARRAARAARHARPPGRLLRRPGQAALRLHPRRAAERRGPRVGRGPRQRADPRQPARARADDDARRGASRSARWRCSARSTATSCAWSRSATAAARASCAAARTCARRRRSASSSSRRRPPAPRTCGASRRSPARWASSCCAGTTAS